MAEWRRETLWRQGHVLDDKTVAKFGLRLGFWLGFWLRLQFDHWFRRRLANDGLSGYDVAAAVEETHDR